MGGVAGGGLEYPDEDEVSSLSAADELTTTQLRRSVVLTRSMTPDEALFLTARTSPRPRSWDGVLARQIYD